MRRNGMKCVNSLGQKLFEIDSEKVLRKQRHVCVKNINENTKKSIKIIEKLKKILSNKNAIWIGFIDNSATQKSII